MGERFGQHPSARRGGIASDPGEERLVVVHRPVILQPQPDRADQPREAGLQRAEDDQRVHRQLGSVDLVAAGRLPGPRRDPPQRHRTRRRRTRRRRPRRRRPRRRRPRRRRTRRHADPGHGERVPVPGVLVRSSELPSLGPGVAGLSVEPVEHAGHGCWRVPGELVSGRGMRPGENHAGHHRLQVGPRKTPGVAAGDQVQRDRHRHRLKPSGPPRAACGHRSSAHRRRHRGPAVEDEPIRRPGNRACRSAGS